MGVFKHYFLINYETITMTDVKINKVNSVLSSTSCSDWIWIPKESIEVKGVEKDTINSFIRSMPCRKSKAWIINDKKLIPILIGIKSIEKLLLTKVAAIINNTLEVHNQWKRWDHVSLRQSWDS